MTEIIFDESEWPIVVMRFPAAWTTDEYNESFGRLEKILARAKRFAIVSDTRNSAIPNARERKLSADFIGKHDAAMKKSVACWAVVADSVVARGAVTAISWLRPPPFKSASFATMPEARAWCLERLKSD